jgi:tetratricopeptide (TPR) repeat protein
MIVIPLLLVGATLAAYWGVWTFDFVNFDDRTYIVRNGRLADGLTYENITWSLTADVCSTWHPLTLLSYLLDAELFGIDSGPFHATNLLLHIANTLLLYVLLFRWSGAAGLSGFVAALFAIHPLHVESVAWVSERKDVLSTFFGLWALLAYGAYALRHSAGWYLTALAMFALSLTAKQMLVTLPFLLLLLDVWPLKRTPLTSKERHEDETAGSSDTSRGIICPPSPWSRLVVEKIPFFVLSVVASLGVFLVQLRTGAVQPLHTFPLTERVANAIMVYVVYLAQMFWPTRLAVFYPYPEGTQTVVQTIAAALLLLAITSVAVRLRRKHWYLLVGWFWYLGTLIPVIGLVQVGDQRMADRYTYFPLIGIFIAVTWSFWHLFSSAVWRRRLLPAVALLLLVAMLGLTYQQTRHWRNSEGLWSHAIEVTEGNSRAHTNLGGIYFADGRREEAIRQYRIVLKMRPEFPSAHCNLGGALMSLGRNDEAALYFRQALQVDPAFVPAHINWGNMLFADGYFAEAIGHYLEALKSDEKSIAAQHPFTHKNVATAYARLGQLDQAAAHYRAALRLSPNFAAAHFSLANALSALGRYSEAIPHYETALRIDPNIVGAPSLLAKALREHSRANKAVRHFERDKQQLPDAIQQ